jgi:hypothetical protein
VENWRTFVSVSDDIDVPDLGLEDYKARLILWLENGDPRTATCIDEITITIYSPSREVAMSCLDFLVGLPDTYFNKLSLIGALDNDENRICPFANLHLKHILRRDAKQTCFYDMDFTAAQCRVIVSSGSRTDLVFSHCGFRRVDAILDSSAERRDEDDSGPAKLTFGGFLLLKKRKLWSIFWSCISSKA